MTSLRLVCSAVSFEVPAALTLFGRAKPSPVFCRLVGRDAVPLTPLVRLDAEAGGCFVAEGGRLDAIEGEGDDWDKLIPFEFIWSEGGGGRFILLCWSGPGLVATAAAIVNKSTGYIEAFKPPESPGFPRQCPGERKDRSSAVIKLITKAAGCSE